MGCENLIVCMCDVGMNALVEPRYWNTDGPTLISRVSESRFCMVELTCTRAFLEIMTYLQNMSVSKCFEEVPSALFPI